MSDAANVDRQAQTATAEELLAETLARVAKVEHELVEYKKLYALLREENERLKRGLNGQKAEKLPQNDAWNTPYLYQSSQGWGTSTAAQEYQITSYGKDQVTEGGFKGGPTTNFDCDIVYSNGAFLQYAEGVQQ